MDYEIFSSFVEENRKSIAIALISFVIGGITAITASAIVWHMPLEAYFSLFAISSNIAAEIAFALATAGAVYLLIEEKLP